MLRLGRVFESALYVSDLERAISFYRDVLGLRVLGEVNLNRGAAFRVGQTVLLIFRAEETLKGGILPPHGATGSGHVAFLVEPEDLGPWRRHLTQHGVRIEKEHSFRNNPPSIYFRDPDGNLLELAVFNIWPWERAPR
jgi:catechol 2,3-dioxygenase-like lactoylglutathione lyase family enzyme